LPLVHDAHGRPRRRAAPVRNGPHRRPPRREAPVATAGWMAHC